MRLVFIFLVFSFASLHAQEKPLQREMFNLYPQAEKSIGYTQAIKIGDVLYISGTVGEGDSMRTQLIAAYDDIKKTLSRYGADFSDIVKENIFTTDIEQLKKNKDIRKNYYIDGWPTASWVEVRRLYSPEFLVEIEVIAHLKKQL